MKIDVKPTETKPSLLGIRLEKIKAMIYEAQDVHREIKHHLTYIKGSDEPTKYNENPAVIKEPESVLEKLDFSLNQLDFLLEDLKFSRSKLSDLTGL